MECKNIKGVGTVVLGTVRRNLHDMGKNLVGMMLEEAIFGQIVHLYQEAIRGEVSPLTVLFKNASRTTNENLNLKLQKVKRQSSSIMRIIPGGSNE